LKTTIPVVPGADVPYMPVGTTPSSSTIQAKKKAIEDAVSDPYNPATRFAQYFPPQPPAYEPPMFTPNNYPVPPLNTCLPPQVFQGSTKKK